MKIMKEMISLWKNDANWSTQSRKGKASAAWFAISLCLVLVAGLSWLTIPALVSLALSIITLKNVEVSE